MPSGTFSKRARNINSLVNKKNCGGNKKAGLAPTGTGSAKYLLALQRHPAVNFKISRGGLPCPENYTNNTGGQCTGGVGGIASNRNRGCRYPGKTQTKPYQRIDRLNLTKLGFSIYSYQTIEGAPEGSVWFENPYFRVVFECNEAAMKSLRQRSTQNRFALRYGSRSINMQFTKRAPVVPTQNRFVARYAPRGFSMNFTSRSNRFASRYANTAGAARSSSQNLLNAAMLRNRILARAPTTPLYKSMRNGDNFPWKDRNYEGYYINLTYVNQYGLVAGAYKGQLRTTEVDQGDGDLSTWLYDKDNFIGFDYLEKPVVTNNPVIPPEFMNLPDSNGGQFEQVVEGPEFNQPGYCWIISVSDKPL